MLIRITSRAPARGTSGVDWGAIAVVALLTLLFATAILAALEPHLPAPIAEASMRGGL